jgi:hypothetical protein
MRNLCGVRVTTCEVIADKEAWYMAWIVVVPPSPRHPHERYQVCYQEGKRDPRCVLVVFEAVRPFRGLEVRRVAELIEGDVTVSPRDLLGLRPAPLLALLAAADRP